MRSRKFAVVPGGLLNLASNRMFEISTRVREREKRPSWNSKGLISISLQSRIRRLTTPVYIDAGAQVSLSCPGMRLHNAAQRVRILRSSVAFGEHDRKEKVTLSFVGISRRPTWPPLFLDVGRRLKGVEEYLNRATPLSRSIVIEGDEMSIISKETREQDKRSLTTFLICLNILLAGAFLLTCFYTG